VTGWIDPTPDQMDSARLLIGAMAEPTEFALRYIGSVLESIAKADFGSDSIRRAIAMHRAWKESK